MKDHAVGGEFDGSLPSAVFKCRPVGHALRNRSHELACDCGGRDGNHHLGKRDDIQVN